MKKLILIAVLVCCTMLSASAQLKVYNNGNVRIGSDYYEDVGMYLGNLRDTTTTLRVIGKDAAGLNASISLGAQYIQGSKTVMIGDATSPNGLGGDLLWLHGSNGFAFTQNTTANDTIFAFNHQDSEFKFKYPVKAEGVLLTSDERLKENVNRAEGALEAVSALNGVSFNYVPRESPMSGYVAGNEYEQQYKDYYDKYYAEQEAKRCSQLHYGFIAQQVQEVLPELVHADDDGYLSVDYIAVIPLLVNAIQELKGRLEAVENGGQTPVVNRAPAAATAVDDVLGTRASEVLSQNDPNPFSSDTRIGYRLPDGISNGTIYIYDLQGKQVKCLDVNSDATGVTLHGGDLPAGMYIYSLVAGGKELASKKMILTK